MRAARTVTDFPEQQRRTRERAVEVHADAARFWAARGKLTVAARERAIASRYREIVELERLLAAGPTGPAAAASSQRSRTRWFALYKDYSDAARRSERTGPD
jgi:hypothetical protein